MIGSLPPGWVLILGALLVPFLSGWRRAAYMLVLPAFGFFLLFTLPPGPSLPYSFFGWKLALVRADDLSLCFGYIFHIGAFLCVIYSLHDKDVLQQTSALIYSGAAIGGVFAGDLVTLFIYWEMTGIASVFLIWSRRTPQALRAGLRYLIVQVGSGVLLLAGILFRGSPEFGSMTEAFAAGDLGATLILLAFGIKCAFPLLHNWLPDAYPEATVTGTVWLSVFTTKLAVCSLARGFPGTEALIWIGAAMTMFPIFYAVIENDLRRVLAYSTINQLGFMVVGVGLGTPMALNGTAAHAFADILFKALLFMSMGAVLFRTGKINGSQLGGLYKSMPLTTVFCIVGAASISAFPFFSAFVTKSLIQQATADNHYTLVWYALLFASAGVFHHAGIKIPFFAFFGHDSGIRCKEAPPNMLAAMGLAAVLCVGIGVHPAPLYDVLPHDIQYVPYTTTHMITQVQLLFLSALAFAFLKRTGIYPPELKSVNLDSDWFYRRLPRLAWSGAGAPVARFYAGCRDALARGLVGLVEERKGVPKPWPLAATVIVFSLILLGYLVVVFWRK